MAPRRRGWGTPPGPGWSRYHSPVRRKTPPNFGRPLQFYFIFGMDFADRAALASCALRNWGNREERGDGLELSLAYPQIAPRMPVLASIVWGQTVHVGTAGEQRALSRKHSGRPQQWTVAIQREANVADDRDTEAQELARLAALEAAQRLRFQRLARGVSGGPDAPPVDPEAITTARDLWQQSVARLRDFQSGTSTL